MRACTSRCAFCSSTYTLSRPNTCVRWSSSPSASVTRFSSSALQTRPERQPESAIRPSEWRREQLPVDARLVVVALEIAERRELDQVRVARVVGGEQRQVRVALLVRLAVRGDVDLAADHRLDAGAAGRLPELHGACHRAVIGQADRRHLELGGPRDEVRDPARTVENRVLGVNVEVDEISLGHRGGVSVRRGPDGSLRARLRLISRTIST